MSQTKDQQIVAKLAEICMYIFNLNKEYLADKLPQKKGKKSSYSLSEFMTETRKMSLDLDFGKHGDRDSLVLIEVGAYRMKFKVGVAFEVLYRFSRVESLPKDFAFEMVDKSEMIDVSDMKKYTHSDSLRPVLNCVYFDANNGFKVATDATIMKIKMIEKTDAEPFMVNRCGVVEKASECYPDYLSVATKTGIKINITNEILKRAYKLAKEQRIEFADIKIEINKITVSANDDASGVMKWYVFEIENDVECRLRVNGKYCNLLAGEKFAEFYIDESNTRIVGKNEWSIVFLMQGHGYDREVSYKCGTIPGKVVIFGDVAQPPVEVRHKHGSENTEQSQIKQRPQVGLVSATGIVAEFSKITDVEIVAVGLNGYVLPIASTGQVSTECESTRIQRKTPFVWRALIRAGRYVAVFVVGVILSVFAIEFGGSSSSAYGMLEIDLTIKLPSINTSSPVDAELSVVRSGYLVERQKRSNSPPW